MLRLYRLFDSHCSELTINHDDSDFHYLKHVRRVKPGDLITVFNSTVGAFKAQVTSLSNKQCVLRIIGSIPESILSTKITLYFSLLKNDATAMVIEKGTELGVTHFVPVITEYTQHQQFNTERAVKQAKQALQQCERLVMPEISAPIYFLDMLQKSHSLVIACVERLNVSDKLQHPTNIFHRLQSLSASRSNIEDICIIVGPEGGWSPGEKTSFFQTGAVHLVSLGSGILKAETAVISALSVVQSWLDSGIS